MSRLRQLGKDSLVYGFGAILAKGVGFFLLPIYTRIFTPAEYGTIEMLSVIASFLGAVLVMGLDSAQSFYFYERREMGRTAQAELVSSILQWRLTWGAGIVVIGTISAPLLNTMFFDGKLGWEQFAVAFAGVFFTQLMSQGVEVFRLLYRPWPYVLITAAQSLGAAGLMLLLILYFDQGIFGYFFGALLSSLVMTVVVWYLVRDYLDFSRLHSNWWGRLMRFGAPLLPGGMSMYVITASDRWFIQHYQGETELGIYALAAKFALLAALGIETFRRAWWPIAMDAMHSPDGPELFRTIARMFMGVGVAAVVYLTFLSPWLVSWLAGQDFHDAWPLVGVLAWQSLFYGFYMVASPGIWKTEKTHYSMKLMIGAAIVNLALNAWLVPQYGNMGAGIATGLAYFLLIVSSVIVSESLWRVEFPFVLLLLQMAVGVLTVIWLINTEMSMLVKVIVVHAVVLVLAVSSLSSVAWKSFIDKSLGTFSRFS